MAETSINIADFTAKLQEHNTNTLPAMPRIGRPDVQKLTGNHHQILKLHAIGLNRTEIAEHLGVTTQTVSNIVNCTLGRRQLDILAGDGNESIGDARAMLQAGQTKAMRTLTQALDLQGGAKDMMTTKDAWNLKIKAAIKLLDKGDHPDKKIQEKRLDVTDNVRNALAEVKEIAVERSKEVQEAVVVESPEQSGNQSSTLKTGQPQVDSSIERSEGGDDAK